MEAKNKKPKLESRTQFTKAIHPGTHTGVHSNVQQSLKDSCNINSIVGRYKTIGVLKGPDGAGQKEAKWGDFSVPYDYKKAQDSLIQAQESFMALPSAVRKKFANDPQKLLYFIANEDNRKEAEELGLIPKSAKPTQQAENTVEAVKKVDDVPDTSSAPDDSK